MVVMRGSGSGADGMERPRFNNDEIRELITTQVTLAIKDVIPEVSGSVKTTLIKMFDECYVFVTKAVAVVSARLQGGGSMKYREFSNTNPPEFDGVKDLIFSMR